MRIHFRGNLHYIFDFSALSRHITFLTASLLILASFGGATIPSADTPDILASLLQSPKRVLVQVLEAPVCPIDIFIMRLTLYKGSET